MRNATFGVGTVVPSALSAVVVDSDTDSLVDPTQCVVTVSGVVDAQRRALRIAASGQVGMPVSMDASLCTAADYAGWKRQADALLARIQTNLEPYSFVTDLDAYLQMFSLPANQRCGALLNSVSVSTPRNVSLSFQTCLSSPSSAPSCCALLDFNADFPTVTADEEKIRNTCSGQFSCVASAIASYASATLNPEQCQPSLTEAGTLSYDVRALLAACSRDIFGGSFFAGVPCTFDSVTGLPIDSKCPAGGLCDIYSGSCTAGQQSSESAFLECMERGMPKYSLLVLK